jgi:hypothetical protein
MAESTSVEKQTDGVQLVAFISYYLGLQIVLLEDRALINQIQLDSQRSPNATDLQLLRDWLSHPRGNRSELRGPGSLIYYPTEGGGLPEFDLLAISPTGDGFLRKFLFKHQLTSILRRLPKSWLQVNRRNLNYYIL